MAVRRIFVVWNHPLFRESVRRLLDRPGIEWVGAGSDRARAHAEIAELQPDTVLIEEPEGDVPSEAIGILEAGSRDLRVIRLSLANNELTVYDRKQRKMVAPEDLLNMIERG